MRKRFRSLRQFVEAHGTQQDAAKVLKVSPPSLSAWLAGLPCGRETALRLSREHGIDLEGLLDPASVGQQQSA